MDQISLFFTFWAIGALDASAAVSGVQAVAPADLTSALDGQSLQVPKLSGRGATLPTVMSGMKGAQCMLFRHAAAWANGGAKAHSRRELVT
jgi:hypothetical protein